jgi:Protein of unknown function (DUF3142)
MTFALPLRVPSPRKLSAVCLGILLTSGVVVLSHIKRTPRPWQVHEVPIAFWSWRNQTPSETDVLVAVNQTGARTIFLRAGQIDYHDGKLRRIRAVTGEFPRHLDLHFVYNATRSLLSQLESVDERALADSLSSAFDEDIARARREGGRVAGLQVDIDVPTRLLDRYARTLRLLRSRLPTGTQLSITGLPTWMDSRALHSTLAEVDFWVPQFYGAEIPDRLEQHIPISSSESVANQVSRAREFSKPFYAGVAAFSWAMLYDPSGALISLRGDLNPAAIASDPNLELIDEKPFEVGEWRLQYKARSDGVIDGMAVHAGDLLVIDLPSSASLRASVRRVRELAGEKLLGICVFRLPALDDPATLTVNEVAAALQDRESAPDVIIEARSTEKQRDAVIVNLQNRGSANARHFNFEFNVPAGTVQEIEVPRGVTFETVCRGIDVQNESAAQPCSQNRANAIRISSFGLRSGDELKVLILFRTAPEVGMPALIEAITDSDVPYAARPEILIER